MKQAIKDEELKIDRENLIGINFNRESRELKFHYKNKNKDESFKLPASPNKVEVYGSLYEVVDGDADILELFNKYPFIYKKILVPSDETLSTYAEENPGLKEFFPIKLNLRNCILAGSIALDSLPVLSIFRSVIVGEVAAIEKIFTSGVTFTESIVAKDFIFSNVEFKKEAFFNKTTFLSKFDFQDTIFFDRAVFFGSYFKNNTRFFNSRFLKSCNFRKCTFNQIDTTMSDFKERLDFKHALFRGHFKLSGNIKNIFLGDIFFTEEFRFEIDSCIIESIDFSTEENDLFRKKETFMRTNEKRGLINIDIKNAYNRETFLQLKRLAVRQNDAVSAVIFHKKESDKYLVLLKERQNNFKEKSYNILKKEWRDNFEDKLILYIEKKVSYFGTSFHRVILWQVAFNIVCFFLYIIFSKSCTSCDNPCYWTDYNLFAQLMIPIKLSGNFDIWNLLQLIGNSFFTYELVKSFRKFSRKF